jgi:ribA/ribD-fused uncharacterized protein
MDGFATRTKTPVNYQNREHAFTGEFAFLSNFHLCEIEFEGETYPSVEHAYQAAKTVNLDERIAIQRCETPAQAKAMGKTVTLRPRWDRVKLSVMESLILQKFSKHRDLTGKLVGTGNTELVELNYWNDTFWGKCKGIGKNDLGEILMVVRDRVQLLTF